MLDNWEWNVSVRSVKREEICFTPNTDWQVQAQGYRLYVNTDLSAELRAQDQVRMTVGELGKPDWAAFIGTVVNCRTDSILLYTSPQYESSLMNTRQLERLFSPLTSIEGAESVIDKLGFFPPFHYDVITKARIEAAGLHGNQKNLSVTIRHTSAGGLEQPIALYFEDIQHEKISPAEEYNICLQLSLAYESDQIRVELDAVSGFEASFLCRKMVVQFHDGSKS
ncbi:hypothetical protein BK120_16860 [Paenibacillus sp. FSL A5-0031]|nr:hypothetical protein BK120_16860 [Paenibacillus sp. FSL A5-0031]